MASTTTRPSVVFDGVWKKFRRGERHTTLRDLVPALARALVRPVTGALAGRPARPDLDAEEFWAIRNVSFEVRPGQALGIVGPNGAGKSTTLKLLTKILRATRGECFVRGRVGALIEVAAGFHPDLTGRENILLQGAIMGMRRAEILEKIDAIVDFAGVADFVDTPVKRYSSGLNARLGFSIAAHLEPDVLIIDEVLAVGDMAFQLKCVEKMLEFRRRGVAIVLVSHDLNAIARLCEQTLLLSRGEARALGPTADVLSLYAERTYQAVSTHDVTVSARLLDADGQPLPADPVAVLAPGDRLLIDVEVRFHRAVTDCLIGVNVWHVGRQLFVYEASSDLAGVPTFRGEAQATRRFRFGLTLNLTRGLYRVDVNVFELAVQRFAAYQTDVGRFQIAEATSQNGVANLFLRPVSDTADPTPARVPR